MEASRLNHLMISQKTQVTKAVNRAASLIADFKREKTANSILIRSTAQATQKSLEAADYKVAALQVTIDRHSKLIMMVCSDLELDNTKKKIDENSNSMDTYIKQVTDLCETEIEAIRQITEQLSPSISPAESTNSSRSSSLVDNVMVHPEKEKKNIQGPNRHLTPPSADGGQFKRNNNFLHLLRKFPYAGF